MALFINRLQLFDTTAKTGTAGSQPVVICATWGVRAIIIRAESANRCSTAGSGPENCTSIGYFLNMIL